MVCSASRMPPLLLRLLRSQHTPRHGHGRPITHEASCARVACSAHALSVEKTLHGVQVMRMQRWHLARRAAMRGTKRATATTISSSFPKQCAFHVPGDCKHATLVQVLAWTILAFHCTGAQVCYDQSWLVAAPSLRVVQAVVQQRLLRRHDNANAICIAQHCSVSHIAC